MPWIKLDANFPTNPKVLALLASGEERTVLLYVFSLCSSQLHLTNGSISLDVLRSFPFISRPFLYAKKLVEAGLWEESAMPNEWIIHDYHLHQRSKEDVEKIREDTRERVQKHRWRNAVTQGVTSDGGNADVTLTDTDTDTDKSLALATPTRKRDELFEALVEVCNYSIKNLSRTERGRLNSATKELRELNASPDEIRNRAINYRSKWSGADLTPQALTGNWNRLEGQQLQYSAGDMEH